MNGLVQWNVVKRHVEETPHSRLKEFESVGEMLRHMRHQFESEMTEDFSHGLSLRLDLVLMMEQWVEEGRR